LIDFYRFYATDIQLGFLNIFKVSSMREEAYLYDMKYSEYPPYEILSTKGISYEELLVLKKVEEMVDKYYNAKKFNNIIKYFIPKFDNPL